MLNGNTVSKLGKKKSVIVAEIDIEKFENLEKKDLVYKPLSKYPSVSLDYTVIMSKDKKYSYLESVLNEFKANYILKYNLVDKYENEKEIKYTIRYILGSDEKTLGQKELEKFKERFIEHIKKNDLDIIQ